MKKAVRADCVLDYFVDCTHLSRRASGIERVTRDLFTAGALLPLKLREIHSGETRAQILAAQWLKLPSIAWCNPHAIFLFPGYPPALSFPVTRVRSILYVHDVFLVTRTQDLNWAGAHYLAPLFKRALREFKTFFCNSETTGLNLREVCSPEAEIMLYRPKVKNAFSLDQYSQAERDRRGRLIVVSIGTVEPRKNFVAAEEICAELSRRLELTVEYHVIGRQGWGPDWDVLARRKTTTLHGYLSEADARAVIQSADIVLCTSHDEGLGLPLLELQYAGLLVVAPSAPVFHEVLGQSGLFISPRDPRQAAETIATFLKTDNWRAAAADRALTNVTQWNARAAIDRLAIISYLQSLPSERKPNV